jgi:CheY-like chemotaxis protein
MVAQHLSYKKFLVGGIMLKKLSYYYNKFKFGEDNFHNLMFNRIQEILFVSTFYDAFIFEQDGRLSEQIFGEYRQLNLSTAPRITSVPTGKQALEILQERHFDVVITMMRIGEMQPFELSKKIKQRYPFMPVLLLLNVQSDITIVNKNHNELAHFDDIFLWNGDTKLFLAMIKSLEDKKNIDFDTRNGFVRVILCVEDSIQYYSMFLPLLFSVVMKQTQKLISEEPNDIGKRLRMRARPKVILVHSYEEAEEYYQKYKEYISAVISDVKYPNHGEIDPDAGIKLIKMIKDDNSDVPCILQSSSRSNAERAQRLGARFLHKYSNTLLNDLKKIVISDLGFGDFYFKYETGELVGIAKTLKEFQKMIKKIPEESLIYHANRNHYSNWLVAHGDIQIAKQLRPLQISDFDSTEHLREYLVKIFKDTNYKRTRGKIINYDPDKLSEEDQIIRLAEGSLGGKGRGLAFLNALLVTMEFDDSIPEVAIKLPSTAIIGTSEYDYFIEHNKITTEIVNLSDYGIQKKFLESELSPEINEKLECYIQHIHKPIAIRSSGLLEDSQSQPFAGIYQTYMLPNNETDDIRAENLKNAVKLVFSSVWLKNARNYIESIHYKLEEEKMAVIIQVIAGDNHNNMYYPHFSGVGQSYNFYPTSYLKNSDGVVSLAVGLGKAVVEGDRNYRFSPPYPKMEIIPQEDILRESQKDFYAIDLNYNDFSLLNGEDATLTKLSVKEAEGHGTLTHMASVWDYQDQRLVPGLFAKGPRVITFANILKYNYFPLAEITKQILEIGEKAMGVPVEIEFAVDLTKDDKKGILPAFYVLQIRPLTINLDDIYIDHDTLNKDDLLLYTESGMGNGMLENITDVIYLDPATFDKTKTREMKEEIANFNKIMNEQNREYILIGPGRWGSRDHFLGIPVKWADINKAKIIIEAGLKDFIVDASQGTHFFHNLVSMNVGYFNVPFVSDTDFIKWDWLQSQHVEKRGNYFVHASFSAPLTVKMDGRKGISVIYKSK